MRPPGLHGISYIRPRLPQSLPSGHDVTLLSPSNSDSFGVPWVFLCDLKLHTEIQKLMQRLEGRLQSSGAFEGALKLGRL